MREPETVGFGSFELDEERSELRREGRRVEILPKPLALLRYLVRHCDRVVPAEEILQVVWPGTVVSDAALASALRQLRRVLGDDGTSQQFVRTLRGRGYRFVAAVHPVDATPLAPSPGDEALSGEIPFGGDVFVGRRPLLRELVRRLEAARTGRGGVVLLAGEAGIGKTGVLTRLAAAARARAFPVQRAWCYEGEGAPPLWPWEKILGGLGQDLESRLGEADARTRFRLFESVSRLLRRIGEEKEGLLLLLDDLHWADSASLQLLEFLMRDLTASTILAVGTFREPEVHGSHPLTATLAACARHDGCERIALEGLRREEIGELLERLRGGPVAAEWVAAIEDRTRGNPFFIRQLLDSLESQGWNLADPAASQRGISSAAIPAGVRDAIRHRLSGLPDDTVAVLELAAAIGTEFDLELLADASGEDRDALAAHLEQAGRLGMVDQDGEGRFHFSHGLIEETVYAEIDEARRSALHSVVAAALEKGRDEFSTQGLAALAHHLGHAGRLEDTGKAIDYLTRAGRQAAERFAYEEADAALARALELLDSALPGARARRAELLCERGLVLHRLGAANTRQTFLDAAAIARELRDGPLLARAAAGFTRGREGGTGEPIDQEMALLSEALELLDEGDDALRAEIAQHLASRHRALGELERGEALIGEATAVAERLGDQKLLAEAEQARAYLLWCREPPENMVGIAQRLVELGDASGAPDPASHGVRLRMVAHAVLGDLEAADEDHTELARRTEEHGLSGWFPTLHGYSGCRAMARGRFKEAADRFDEQLRLGMGFEDQSAFAVYTAEMAELKTATGELSELEPALREFTPKPSEIMPLAFLAAFRSRLGKLEEARRAYDRARAAAVPRDLPRNENRWGALAWLAEAASAVGDRDGAEELYDLLLPRRHHFTLLAVTTVWCGPVATRLGCLARTLGRDQEAAQHFDWAIQRCDAIEAPAWAARARVERARMLLAAGAGADRQLAVGLLANVVAKADALGMRGLGAEARALVAGS